MVGRESRWSVQLLLGNRSATAVRTALLAWILAGAAAVIVPFHVAAEARPVDTRARRVVVTVDIGRGDALSVDAIAESLVSALARAHQHVLVRRIVVTDQEWVRDRGGTAAVPTEALQQLVHTTGGDAYVTLNVERDAGGIMGVSWRIGDLLQNSEDHGHYRTPLLTVRELESRAWIPLLEAVHELVPPRDSLVTLRLHGVPQSEITVTPGIYTTLDDNGRAEIILPIPGDYRIAAKRSGYRPVTRQIALAAVTELELEQELEPVAYAHLGLFNAQFPEIGAGWIPRRGRLSLGGFATFFQVGLAFREQKDESTRSGLTVSVPLTHLGLSVSYLFGQSEQRTRPYLGLQPFLRVSGTNGVRLDRDAAFGLGLNMGLEYRMIGDGALFVEWTPILYPVRRQFSRDELYDGNPGTVVVPTDWAVFELTLMRLGYRHRF